MRSRGSLVEIEALEGRRVLSAAPNVLGLYMGQLNFSDGTSDTLTITITAQHQRSFSGSFAEGAGPVAKLQGNVSAQGAVRFAYRGSGFSGAGTGFFDSTDTIFDATFLTRLLGQRDSGTLNVQLQGARPAIPTIPQLGSHYSGDIEYSDGTVDTMDLTIVTQHQKNVVGYFTEDTGATAFFNGTVDINGTVRFHYRGGGPAQGIPPFTGSGSGTVSSGNAAIDATFTSRQSGVSQTGSFSVELVTG